MTRYILHIDANPAQTEHLFEQRNELLQYGCEVPIFLPEDGDPPHRPFSDYFNGVDKGGTAGVDFDLSVGISDEPSVIISDGEMLRFNDRAIRRLRGECDDDSVVIASREHPELDHWRRDFSVMIADDPTAIVVG